MIKKLAGQIKGTFSLFFLSVNTAAVFGPVLVLSFFKIVLRFRTAQTAISIMLNSVASGWVVINNRAISLIYDIKWSVHIDGELSLQRSYLVISNHQSWIDIMVLQHIFNGRIPFLRFFLKQQLIWIPLLGISWWALDFPFMKRYSQSVLQKKPHLKGRDLETTRKACARFKRFPASIMNFLEGTRYTPQRKAASKSPYTNLLRPRAGGAAFTLSAMRESINDIIDVTIHYPQGIISMWDFLCGKLDRVIVCARIIPIDPSTKNGDYLNDLEFRKRFTDWINLIWEEKDRLLSRLQNGEEAACGE